MQEAVDNSTSYSGVLRYLDLRPSGGMAGHLKNVIIDYGIDTSHFNGHAWNKGQTFTPKKNWEDVLVMNDDKSPRTKRRVLKRCMVEYGIEYKCRKCGVGDSWQGEELAIEINHIDGKFYNNLPDNLEFLCPNCHSQERTSNRPHKYRDKI